MINNYHMKVERTAQYSTYGILTSQTENIWWVCHGYGQLARYFLKKFEALDPQKNFVIAPEALSHFYLKGHQRVGASWMTKEDRLHEIEDYLSYLNTLYDKVCQQDAFPEKAKSLVLGFSQGVATVVRWVYEQKISFDHLVMWAGGFPPDVDFSKTQTVLANKSLSFVYGLQDELITAKQFETERQRMLEKQISPKVVTFEGKHELNGEILQRLIE
ncbi:phospholipase [uncultured Microscilla sp.]|uniref:alpha/beta hydrolase n=1 Tax=uncultured Microscilla sp. TaxID=432653 RepID=UPI0026277DCA|nr:phospholipase [uncultured Microscilla sp.]